MRYSFPFSHDYKNPSFVRLQNVFVQKSLSSPRRRRRKEGCVQALPNTMSMNERNRSR